ncbi:MAG: hypothetical protein DI568_14940 [Sphingomonas sp.]|nr:MAG: hypothetical protein DI568_14940 [Sphingomonas sp.]
MVQRAFTPPPPFGSVPGQSQQAVKQAVKTVDAKWVSRSLLDKLSGALGLRIVFDDVNDRPVLLAGPADAVGYAESYIKSLNRCPVQLKFEGSVIQSADSTVRDVDAGLRVGGYQARFGTSGVTSGTGFNFDLTLLAVDGQDALLALFQDFSAVGVVTDLGPTFSARSVRGVYRVRLDEPQLLAVSGSDSISQSNRRGILSKRDFSNARKDGSFLVFQLRRTACAQEELATTSTAGAAELDR